MFDYMKEFSCDVFCIDVKSFYVSVECVECGFDLLKIMFVVMSNFENLGGLVFVVFFMVKKVLGIFNVIRKNEVLDYLNLIIVFLCMKLYMKKN